MWVSRLLRVQVVQLSNWLPLKYCCTRKRHLQSTQHECIAPAKPTIISLPQTVCKSGQHLPGLLLLVHSFVTAESDKLEEPIQQKLFSSLLTSVETVDSCSRSTPSDR